MAITVTSGRSRLLWFAVAIANLTATASAATFWWDTEVDPGFRAR
jgi:hypothetical protein